MESVDAVFRGKVSSISLRYAKTVTFDVERVWKGENKPQIVVVTYSDSCGNSYALGEEWLVYARYSKNDSNIIYPTPPEIKLITNICLTPRTTRIQSAQEDLEELGVGKIPPPTPWYQSKKMMQVGALLLLLSVGSTWAFIKFKRPLNTLKLK